MWFVVVGLLLWVCCCGCDVAGNVIPLSSLPPPLCAVCPPPFSQTNTHLVALLEAAPQLDDVAVRERPVQADLPDQLGLVEPPQLLHVVHLDGARLSGLAVDGLFRFVLFRCVLVCFCVCGWLVFRALVDFWSSCVKHSSPHKHAKHTLTPTHPASHPTTTQSLSSNYSTTHSLTTHLEHL